MSEGHRQGGGAVAVEADVILHAVNPDLSMTPENDGKLCPYYVQGFLQEEQDFSPPAVFQKEYLLDGRLVDGERGNGSYAPRENQGNLSNDKEQTDSSVSNHNSTTGLQQNYTHSKNHNGSSIKVSKAKQEAGDGVCVLRETRGSPSDQATAVPGTHCISAGTKPTLEDLGQAFPPGSRAADPPAYESLYGRSVLKSNIQSGDSIREAPDSATSDRTETDLVIEVGGKTISAHKSVLAEKSDYFKARLSRDILKVKGISYKTLTTLVDYVYTSKMNVRKDNVVDVITGAKILQIPCAVQAAMDSMSEQITPGNCYEILTIAKKQRLSELKETAYRFMSDNFLQILKDPSVYGRLTGSERDLILKKRMEGKTALMVAEINDVFDRSASRPASRCSSRPQSPLSVASFEETHMIYCFDETANDWRPLTAMPEDVNTKGCGICTMYNYLFVAGGIKGYGDKGKVSDKVFCYNPVTDSWAEVRPLKQARAQLKLVSTDGHLYAVGGECLFTVEKYDPRMDRWTTVAPLPKGAFAVAHEATTCNGELYVSGGSLFYRLLRYDAKRDEWQECPYNNSRKRSTDMVALKSFIYRFDVNREQGISVFKYNTIVKMWHDCASQRLGSHLPFRCAVIGNCIYCVNKSQTLQFLVEEQSGHFVEEPLRPPLDAKGVLFPFVLTLPEKTEKVT
ncbi:kelch repeat and BTB domain-containing protein 11 [Genypterus blacodes]|uniref:kelch repeat and BTB domain-containing protein 11 n=1 Tax=Genypterus blacodes TaxID=154954 RepID=UPI003F76CF7D